MSHVFLSLHNDKKYSFVFSKFLISRCLPCGHTFCNECINGIQNSSLEDFSSCPICRQQFQNNQQLPKNYSILEITDLSVNSDKSSKKLLCDKSKKFEEDTKINDTPKMCIIHPNKKLKFFCLNCEESICSKCFSHTHIRHSLEKPLHTSIFLISS